MQVIGKFTPRKISPKALNANAYMYSNAWLLLIYYMIKSASKPNIDKKLLGLLITGVKDYAIFMIDPQGYIVSWNKGAERIKGYRESEILGKHISIFYTQADIEKNEPQHNLNEAIRSGSYENEGWRVRKDGSIFWANAIFTPLFDEDQKLLGFAKVTRDATEQKKIEDRRKEQYIELEKQAKANTEKALAAEIHYRKLIENSHDGIALFDKDFNVFYRSPSAQRITGWSKEERDGLGIEDIVHPDDRTLVSGLFLKILNKPEEPVIFNYRVKHREGHYIWLECVFDNKLNDPDMKAIVCNFRDVTARKESEQLLQRTINELSAYRVALDESSIVAITDQKGIIKHVNDNFCRISKYSREELLGQDHRIINSSYHEKAFITNLWHTIANGRIWKGELKNKARDGSYYWVDTTIVPFLNDRGKPYQYVAIRSDISERKEAESEIQRTVKELSAFKYALDESAIVAITDHKGIIKHVNDNFCRISKYSREELLGQDHRIINSSSHEKAFIAGLWRTIANGKIWKGELKNKAKDGSYYWVDTTIVPFLNDLGKPYQYLAIRSDITERKNSEIHLKELNENLQNHAKELAASNEELEQFAYVASHDLQEPLRMVTGFLTQLEKKYQDVIDEKGKQYIYFAVDGAKRMRQIILDLLEYSRAGKTVAGLERVNLNKLMDEMRGLYRKQLDAGAQLLSDELPVIFSYKTSVWQILQNLIGNALKYHKKDVMPVVKVTCSETNTHWHFCVEDNGIGIESEYFTKIFIIFQRLHRKGEYSGTGIGLAIAKKLVENLGGKIWVDSVKNEGTKFYFTILKNETS